MAKKRENDETKPVEDPVVRCRCVRECAWRGMRYEGSVVELRQSQLGEPFFSAHFQRIGA